jgi:hypothetical protein
LRRLEGAAGSGKAVQSRQKRPAFCGWELDAQLERSSISGGDQGVAASIAKRR